MQEAKNDCYYYCCCCRCCHCYCYCHCHCDCDCDCDCYCYCYCYCDYYHYYGSLFGFGSYVARKGIVYLPMYIASVFTLAALIVVAVTLSDDFNISAS